MPKLISSVSLAVLIAAGSLTGEANAVETAFDKVLATKKPLAAAVQNQALWAGFADTDAIFNRTINNGGDVAEEIKSLLVSAENTKIPAIERAATLQLARLASSIASSAIASSQNTKPLLGQTTNLNYCRCRGTRCVWKCGTWSGWTRAIRASIEISAERPKGSLWSQTLEICNRLKTQRSGNKKLTK